MAFELPDNEDKNAKKKDGHADRNCAYADALVPRCQCLIYVEHVVRPVR
jgi:hypothetical protein